MKAAIGAIVSALITFRAVATPIGWGATYLVVDIRGDLSTVGAQSFATYFENSSMGSRFSDSSLDAYGLPNGGIDVIVKTTSGIALNWAFQDKDTGEWFEDVIGLTLLKDGGGYDYSYSSRNQQINVSDLYATDVVQLWAGVIDWENLPDGAISIEDYFTPFAYTEASFADISERYIYVAGEIDPPAIPWTPTSWNPVVPEPSTAMLSLCGAILLLKRRKS